LLFLLKPMFHKHMLLLVLLYSSTISILFLGDQSTFKEKLISIICFTSKNYYMVDLVFYWVITIHSWSKIFTWQYITSSICAQSIYIYPKIQKYFPPNFGVARSVKVKQSRYRPRVGQGVPGS
jgi:hypothetical protein